MAQPVSSNFIFSPIFYRAELGELAIEVSYLPGVHAPKPDAIFQERPHNINISTAPSLYSHSRPNPRPRHSAPHSLIPWLRRRRPPALSRAPPRSRPAARGRRAAGLLQGAATAGHLHPDPGPSRTPWPAGPAGRAAVLAGTLAAVLLSSLCRRPCRQQRRGRRNTERVAKLGPAKTRTTADGGKLSAAAPASASGNTNTMTGFGR